MRPSNPRVEWVIKCGVLRPTRNVHPWNWNEKGCKLLGYLRPSKYSVFHPCLRVLCSCLYWCVWYLSVPSE